MNVITTLKKKVTGLNFRQVCEAMEASNLPSDRLGEIENLLEEKGIKEVPHIFMANHSWGGRQWKLVEGAIPAFYADPYFQGGWYILTEEDVSYLFCSSHTSGSSVEANRCQDGTWNLTLEVPIEEDGTLYEGSYWQIFHQALGMVDQTEEQEAPQEETDHEGPILSL